MYCLSDSEVNTLRPRFGISLYLMTERMRLISCLLYGLFSAILKKNTIKNTGCPRQEKKNQTGLKNVQPRKHFNHNI